MCDFHHAISMRSRQPAGTIPKGNDLGQEHRRQLRVLQRGRRPGSHQRRVPAGIRVGHQDLRQEVAELGSDNRHRDPLTSPRQLREANYEAVQSLPTTKHKRGRHPGGNRPGRTDSLPGRRAQPGLHYGQWRLHPRHPEGDQRRRLRQTTS
jgi:hypothetical protein